MAKKPNYGFEKRQKELAKKQKRDEKRQRKLQAGWHVLRRKEGA